MAIDCMILSGNIVEKQYYHQVASSDVPCFHVPLACHVAQSISGHARIIA